MLPIAPAHGISIRNLFKNVDVAQGRLVFEERVGVTPPATTLFAKSDRAGAAGQAMTLFDLQTAIDHGFMPVGRLIWVGLGVTPPKRNAIEVALDRLPTLEDCFAVTGLDVVLIYRGDSTRYGVLKKLCDRLLLAMPRRLQVVDLDSKHVAYLKLGNA